MAARKLSISMPDGLAEAALASAQADGVGLSAWVAGVVRAELRRRIRMDAGFVEAQALVAEYEAEHGPIPETDWAWGRQVLADSGPPRQRPSVTGREGELRWCGRRGLRHRRTDRR